MYTLRVSCLCDQRDGYILLPLASLQILALIVKLLYFLKVPTIVFDIAFQLPKTLFYFFTIYISKGQANSLLCIHITLTSFVYCYLYLSLPSEVKKFEFRNFSQHNMFYSMFLTIHIFSLQNHKHLCWLAYLLQNVIRKDNYPKFIAYLQIINCVKLPKHYFP